MFRYLAEPFELAGLEEEVGFRDEVMKRDVDFLADNGMFRYLPNTRSRISIPCLIRGLSAGVLYALGHGDQAQGSKPTRNTDTRPPVLH